MKMKVLVTGAAGYLGSILCERLLLYGNEVVAVDDLSRGIDAPLKHLVEYRDTFRFLRFNAGDPIHLGSALEGCDAVVPLAGIVGQKACDRDLWRAKWANVDAIRTLLEIRRENQRVVFPATNSGYGTRTGQILCDESTPLEPVSHYGVTKVEAEKLVLRQHNTVSLRFATLFGPSPAMRWDLLVHHFVREAIEKGAVTLYEGHFQRNYLHVRDAAEAIIFALTHDKLTGAYNVGTKEAWTKRELAELVKAAIPWFNIHEGEGRDPDQRNYRVSTEKIEKAGWMPSFSVHDWIPAIVTAHRMETGID